MKKDVFKRLSNWQCNQKSNKIKPFDPKDSEFMFLSDR